MTSSWSIYIQLQSVSFAARLSITAVAVYLGGQRLSVCCDETVLLGAALKWTPCVNREGEFSGTLGTLGGGGGGWGYEGGHTTFWLKYLKGRIRHRCLGWGSELQETCLDA